MKKRRRKKTSFGATTRESDIVYENDACWVRKDRKSYTVFKIGLTHSTSDSSYRKNPDGLSIAKARCDYLARKK
jgi:hypothetical protein